MGREDVEKRKFTWSDLWTMESNRLSFIVRATYDVLPSPTNLQLWLGKDPSCPLCTAPVTLKHILVSCRTSLIQERYTWRHNQVLKCRRVSSNAQPLNNQGACQSLPIFVREGDKLRIRPSIPDLGPLNMARDWQMKVHLDQKLTFPSEIATTTLRANLIL